MRSALAEVPFRPLRLRGARVLLRGYEPTDAAAISRYATDPETTRYVAWDTHTAIDQARDFLDGWVADSYRKRQLDYAICPVKQPERVIGGIGVLVASEAHKTMELGYILHREFWGRGLMPEAGRLLLDHAFESTDVERIFAPIFAENHKSRRVAEKLGMTLDGVLRSALLLRGRRWDEAIYSILRPEWAALRSVH